MQVFVSHGWADAWVARQMARCIQDCGADVFIDVYDIQSGDDIPHSVKAGIRASDELVALLTPLSRKRAWVWAEMGAAWGQDKRLVAVLYGVTRQDLENEGGAAMLGQLNHRDLNDFDSHLNELKRRIDHG